MNQRLLRRFDNLVICRIRAGQTDVLSDTQWHESTALEYEADVLHKVTGPYRANIRPSDRYAPLLRVKEAGQQECKR